MREERTHRRLNRAASQKASAASGEDKGGNIFKGVLNKEIIGKVPITAPREATGKNSLLWRIVPYTVSRAKYLPDNAELSKKDAIQNGDLWAGRKFGIHKNVGGSGKNVLCPAVTFGKKCACCEEQRILRQDWDKNRALIKALKPEIFMAYNYIDTNKTDDGLQLFIWKFSKFAEQLKEEIASGEPECLGYADSEEGVVLKLRIIEDSFVDGNGKTVNFLTTGKIDFKDVKEFRDLSEKTLAKAVKLDEMFIEMAENEMAELYMGGAAEDDDDDEPKGKDKKKDKAKGKSKVEEDDDDSDDGDSDDDDDDDKPKGKKSKAKGKPKDDDDDDDDDAEDDSDEEDADDEDDSDDDDAEDDKPSAKAKGKVKKSKPKDEDDDDDDDDDSDDDSDDSDEDDDDEDAKPKAKAKVKRKVKPSKDDDDDDDDDADDSDDDDDDDEDAKPKGKKKDKPKGKGTKW